MHSSFEEFVRWRGDALVRFTAVLCNDGHQANDLVQTALARAYPRWRRIERMEHPEAYLKAMIVNDYLSWRRRRSSHEVPAGDASDSERHTGADEATIQASRDAAWGLLDRLPRKQRAVLVLRYYEDFSDAQIASALRCTESSVRSTASRALSALRDVVPTLNREMLP